MRKRKKGSSHKFSTYGTTPSFLFSFYADSSFCLNTKNQLLRKSHRLHIKQVDAYILHRLKRQLAQLKELDQHIV